MTGRDPALDLIALVERRLVEAGQGARRSLPLVAAPGAGARLSDLARLLVGELDLERTVTLARALMSVRWEGVELPRSRVEARGARPDEAWELLRICALPFPIRDRHVASEPAMFRRLASGDAAGAASVAIRRLRASGFRPPLAGVFADPATARRWAAAFAFPVDPAVADAMAGRFQNLTATETP